MVLFMKIINPLQFTENHRFYIFRDFSLSPLDQHMLYQMYQPMLGSGAIALYNVLYQQLPVDQIGYSGLEQQRKLFLSLGLEPGVNGRKAIIDYTSQLEAVGLLQTVRQYNPHNDEYIYEYQMLAPLGPYEFFENYHLTLLLRDRVGKHAVLHLQQQFCVAPPEELASQALNAENVSAAFYDLFQLNPNSRDVELEETLAQIAPTKEQSLPWMKETGFRYEDIIIQFPRSSRNRPCVERLKQQPHRLTEINFVARKYKLTLQEICRLLDEDDVFTEEGVLQFDLLQQKANLLFRQSRKREEGRERVLHRLAAAGQATGEEDGEAPSTMIDKAVAPEFYLDVPAQLQQQCSIEQYNMFLRNRSYIEVLDMFFPGNVPDHILNIFERIDLYYKLNEEVINVLVHYLKAANLSWNRPFIESIAADMLGKQVDSFERAVGYVREQTAVKKKGSGQAKGRGTAARGGRPKPSIPMFSGEQQGATVTDEDYERILQKAQRLKK